MKMTNLVPYPCVLNQFYLLVMMVNEFSSLAPKTVANKMFLQGMERYQQNGKTLMLFLWHMFGENYLKSS